MQAIVQQEFDWLRVTFDYDVDLKDELMESVGKGNYRYQPGTRAWRYRMEYRDVILSILGDYGYDIIELEAKEKLSSKSRPTEKVNPWDAVFASIDKDLSHKLYLAATKALHPDTGGETKAMQELNQSWEDYR